MNNQVKKAHLSASHPSKKRPTIGVLARRITHYWALAQLQGMIDACRELDANLIYFPGGVFASTEGQNESQHNIVYDLASTADLDGLIISTSTVTGYLSDDDTKDFLKRFYPRPIVGLERPLAGVPTVLKSEYEAMAEIMAHLIEVHGYRRILYVNRVGPLLHHYRYRAYVDTLARYDIPYNPDFVFSAHLPQDWFGSLRPGIDYDAVVTADDNCAGYARQALQAQGVHVPDQVALTGFDDIARSAAMTPPLTTIGAPFHELGHKAVEMLLALLNGESVPDQVVLPCKLMIRQSCGCMSTEVINAKIRTQLESSTADVAQASQSAPPMFDRVLSTQREAIVAEIKQIVDPSAIDPDPGSVEGLLDALLDEVKGQLPGLFLRKLSNILNRNEITVREVQLWQTGISALRRRLSPYLTDEKFALADDLWHQGRVMIGQAVERAQTYQALQDQERAQVLRETGQELITTFSIEGLMDILAADLPRLGFPSGYLALYETPPAYQYPALDLGLAKLALAYNEQGRITPGPAQRRFPAGRLLPEGLWPDRQFIFEIEPLYFREDQIGFILFEIGPREGTSYDALRGQISSALEGALLVAQKEKHTRQLQTVAEVTTTTSTILEMSELLQRVVDMAAARFGLYHAHIYLLTEAGDTLVSAAGAGEVGRRMVAENWHIALDTERSLVARAARLRKGEICNDIHANSSWLLNPLLPDAQAELVAPLIAGDVVLGVLDVQSDEANSFTENDLRIQSTLAGQIAATLQNVKLFEQITLANAEIHTLNEQLKRENLRMTAELDVSRRLQQMLLPSDRELSQVENLDVAGFMEPADEVGGDYYDVLQYKGAVKFGIGDVTGHGLESGVLMLMLQTSVRTLLTSEEKDPVRFMDILNQTLYQNLRRMDVDRNLTLALVDYAPSPDAQYGQMRLIGQHEQVIVVRKDGQIELKDTLDLGFPLALVSGITQFVGEIPIQLNPGDGIVLYSDGITEAENEAGQFYGLERLCVALSRHWDKSANDIKQAVVTDIRQFIGQQKIFDDLTLLVIKQR
ncbi:MAG: SpoIIE family protein phosphatase [Anaerolineae bacterium]|nr:SpoIIE family protein phosphatase [Anaerolineae bacterium]